MQFELDQADLDTADIEYFVVFDAAGHRWTLPVEPSMWEVEGTGEAPRE